ncbi:hypothetical protein [Streptomyces minutiscleroticus]|uniref:Uncharacterized protein n=1 Tax=Streptomyces minutiscleroticus TaxID=68238 RepID=A0A918K968_9ACTN|nr:hypothetical protein [Streptomyces minutiscleroticus]GGX52412.1 hypothetical protein GCM10010358_02620 [Streptomyces minutiscleroticus]
MTENTPDARTSRPGTGGQGRTNPADGPGRDTAPHGIPRQTPAAGATAPGYEGGVAATGAADRPYDTAGTSGTTSAAGTTPATGAGSGPARGAGAGPRTDGTAHGAHRDGSPETGAGTGTGVAPEAAEAAVSRVRESAAAHGSGHDGGVPTGAEDGVRTGTRTGAGTGGSVIAREETDELERQLHHAVAGFVDEPRASVEEADHVLQEVAARFTDAVDRRRRSLRTSWQAAGDGKTDTEQLRLALRDYRELAERLLKV